MTHKDYEIIARAIRQSLPALRYINYRLATEHNQRIMQMQHKITCQTVAAELGRKMDNFNRDKFMKACGYEIHGNTLVLQKDLCVSSLENAT